MKCRRETIGKDSKEGRADIWQDKRKSGQEGRKEVGTWGSRGKKVKEVSCDRRTKKRRKGK